MILCGDEKIPLSSEGGIKNTPHLGNKKRVIWIPLLIVELIHEIKYTTRPFPGFKIPLIGGFLNLRGGVALVPLWGGISIPPFTKFKKIAPPRGGCIGDPQSQRGRFRNCQWAIFMAETTGLIKLERRTKDRALKKGRLWWRTVFRVKALLKGKEEGSFGVQNHQETHFWLYLQDLFKIRICWNG